MQNTHRKRKKSKQELRNAPAPQVSTTKIQTFVPSLMRFVHVPKPSNDQNPGTKRLLDIGNIPYQYRYETTKLTWYEWSYLGTNRPSAKRPWVRNDWQMRQRKSKHAHHSAMSAALFRECCLFLFFPFFFSCFVLLFHFLFGFLWLLISVFTTTKQLTVRMKLSFFPIFVSRNKQILLTKEFS